MASKFHHLSQRDCELAVSIVLNALGNSIAKGQRVEVRGFGSFSVKHRNARIGRNPRSGESVAVPAKLTPHFKQSKDLKRKLGGADVNG